jgi:hypothetical protein
MVSPTWSQGRSTAAKAAILAGAIAAIGFIVRAVVRKLSQSEAERLKALEPDTRTAFLQLRRNLAAQKIQLFVGQTRRDPKHQATLVARGKSATLQSWHLVGRAIDAYPFDPTTGKPDMAGKNVELYRTYHREAAKLGFKGLAFNPDGSRKYINTNKGKVWDAGHIQYQGQFKTVADAAKAAPSAIVA